MQKRMFGNDNLVALWLMIGLPMLASIIASVLRAGFNLLHIFGIGLMSIGTFLIIKSKASESITNRWKSLGPPLDNSKRKRYFTGYSLYLVGFVVLFYNWYGGIDMLHL